MQLDQITVIVPTRNEEHNIVDFCRALPAEVWLIVVDASVDATPDLVRRNRPERTRVVVSRATLLFGIGLVVAVLFASVSPLVFDAPGSADDPRAWATFFFLCTSPIPFLIGIIGAWLSYALQRYRLALMLMGLPLLGVGVILLCVRYGEGF